MMETIREFGLERLRDAGGGRGGPKGARGVSPRPRRGSRQRDRGRRPANLARSARSRSAQHPGGARLADSRGQCRLGAASRRGARALLGAARAVRRGPRVAGRDPRAARCERRGPRRVPRRSSPAAVLAAAQRDDDTLRLFSEALEIYRELGDSQGMAAALNGLAVFKKGQGDLDEARRLLEESVGLFSAQSDGLMRARSLSNVASILKEQRDYRRRARAAGGVARALPSARRSDRRRVVAASPRRHRARSRGRLTGGVALSRVARGISCSTGIPGARAGC